jgi:hypothetical protein
MSQENTQQLLIDSQESSSQGNYFPKKEIQNLESPESPQPPDVDEIVGALSTLIVSPSEENMEESQPTLDAAVDVDDIIKRFEQEKMIREKKIKENVDAFLEVCKKLEE